MVNYSDEQTEYLVGLYEKDPTPETVQLLARELEKSTKSIIGKLSREGVYKRAVYKNKSGGVPITKVELVASISDNLRIEIEDLDGLDKAPKSVLQALERVVLP